MNNLFVYGDSFASPSAITKETWVNILADSLNYQVVNNAVLGSSTEYSFFKFVKDAQNDIFKEEDIIIFVISSPGRLYFNYQLFDDPSTGSRFLGPIRKTDLSNLWYKQNKDNIKWYVRNTNQELNQINHESYIEVLKSFARKNPKLTFFVMHNPEPLNLFKLDQCPPNFFMPDICLVEISNREIIDQTNRDFSSWTRYTDIDCRLNHLTNPNHKILANSIKNTITKKTIDFWNYDLFHQGIIKQITDLAEYKHFVDKQILFQFPRIEKKLSKKVSIFRQCINKITKGEHYVHIY